jgi:hypothetical protein
MNIYTIHNNYSSRQILKRIFGILFGIQKNTFKNISFFDFDLILSKKNSKCVSNPDLAGFTSTLCGFVIAFLYNFFLCGKDSIPIIFEVFLRGRKNTLNYMHLVK